MIQAESSDTGHNWFWHNICAIADSSHTNFENRCVDLTKLAELIVEGGHSSVNTFSDKKT